MAVASTSKHPPNVLSDDAPSHIFHELDFFLKGAAKGEAHTNIKVAQSAIYLLKVLPSSHDAVLEYMCRVFDDAVGGHVHHPEGPHEEEPVIQELLQVFSGFLVLRPKVWAPTLTSWSLNLLGSLSAKYAAKDRPGLPQSLHFWTECSPTRALIELSHSCLSAMLNANVEPCLATLLETSVQFGPHFDWVVAHLASCFPQTVIGRVLAAGLKDFAQGDVKAKVASVVGILEHLIGHHATAIRESLVHMFYSSLAEHPTREQLSIIPYILSLAALSPDLASIVVDEFIKAASKPNLMSQLHQRWLQWRGVPGTEDLLTLCRNLAADSEPLIRTLHTMATHRPLIVAAYDSKVRVAAGLVLDYVLLDVQHKVLSGHGEPPRISARCLLASDSGWSAAMLQLVCLARGPVTATSTVDDLLSAGKVEMAYSLLMGLSAHKSDLPVGVVSQLLSGPRLDRLYELVQMNPRELCPQEPETLAELLMENPAPHTMGLLSLACQPEAMGPVAFIKAAQATVRYFFRTIAQPHSNAERMHQLHIAQTLLAALSQQSAAQQAILRQLLSEALGSGHCKHFGSHLPESQPPSNMSLLRENSNIAISITLPQSHSSVFHAGVIGEGLRHVPRADPMPTAQVAFNKQVFLDTVQACCRPSWRFPSDKLAAGSSLVSGMKTVALLLVELISPDVMFNGLPWPDDDFQKVTIERDLHIKRQFEQHPLLWDLLELVAAVPPSLCYCSVLLRAHAALLIQYWGGCQAEGLATVQQLSTTKHLLGLLSAGQLLPPPLSQVSLLVDMLTPWELHCVLSDIWQYMRDNVPSPALFRTDTMTRADPTLRCPPHYTQRLRHILIANIHRFGPLYAKLFPITQPSA